VILFRCGRRCHTRRVLTNIRGLAFRRPAPIFRAMSSLPRACLSQKLVQPLPTKEGVVLRTVGEAANYVLALPPEAGVGEARRKGVEGRGR
jgi:hypothetical protein